MKLVKEYIKIKENWVPDGFIKVDPEYRLVKMYLLTKHEGLCYLLLFSVLWITYLVRVGA